MKHLKKFNENTDSDISILKEYFFNISEDLDDICELVINQNTSNFFTIFINQKRNIKGTIDQSSINKIDVWIESNQDNSRILAELKSSINRLDGEELLENFSLNKNIDGYKLEVFTKIKSDSDIENWIFVEPDYSVWYDQLRLKNLIKNRFNLEITNSYFSEDYDKYEKRYLQFNITFKDLVEKSKLQEVVDFLSKIRAQEPDDDDTFEIFDGGTFSKHRESSRDIWLYLHDSITDYD